MRFTCDGVTDCRDGADEDEALCGIDPCEAKLRCKVSSSSTGQFTRNDVTPLNKFFLYKTYLFFLCQTLSSIQLDFLSFTRHIWISIQMNIQRVQWPLPTATKAQTCHLQNFITLFGDLLSCQNHWNAFGSFLSTNQVVRYPKNQRESIKSWLT